MAVEQSKSKGKYLGGSLERGGGDWIGSSTYDMNAALESFKSDPQAAQDTSVRELDGLFVALRDQAAQTVRPAEMEIVAREIDFLQQELEKGAAADDNVCEKSVQRLAISWAAPASGEALQQLLQTPPLAELFLPATRALVDFLAAS